MSTLATFPQEAFTLITRDLDEVLGGDSLKAILNGDGTPANPPRPLRAYWGTAPTSRPHIGYFAALTKIADFLRAGVQVKILLADIHAFLDNLKAPIGLVRHRVHFYKAVLLAVFRAIGVPTDRLTFVVGSDYQLTPEYTMDVYRAAALTSEHDSKKAGAEVVKQVASPLMSSMLYPSLQALDEHFLDVDFQFGGVDQRKIFTFAEALLPKLGYKKRAHLMNPMVPGLKGAKMSASDHASKIDFLDSADQIRSKIKSAVCEPKSTPAQGNGVLAFCRAVLFPISRLRLESGHTRDGESSAAGLADSYVPADAPEGTLFSLARPEKLGGGHTHYADYAHLEADFVSGEVHPADLKKAVADALCKLLAPVYAAFQADDEWRKVDALAYPSGEAADADKGKKKKDKKVNPRHLPVSQGGVVPDDEWEAQQAERKAGKGAKAAKQQQQQQQQQQQKATAGAAAESAKDASSSAPEFVQAVEALSVSKGGEELQQKREEGQGQGGNGE